MAINNQDTHSDSSVPLMSGVQHDINYDMEANTTRKEPKEQHTNLDHEYTIPSTIKFTWLGTYFLLSLLLTIYNKLVLGVVRVSSSYYFPP